MNDVICRSAKTGCIGKIPPPKSCTRAMELIIATLLGQKQKSRRITFIVVLSHLKFFFEGRKEAGRPAANQYHF